MIRMRRLLIAIIVLCFVFALACSRSGSDDSTSGSDTVSSLDQISDANQALELGNQLLENNETERAIDAFLRATELNPDLAEAWFQLGIAYALIEKEQAVNAENDTNLSNDNSAKPVKPNSEKAFRKAIEAYKKLLAQEPDNADALYNLGRAYNKLNQDEDAAKSLRQAVHVSPDDAEYQTELGAILIKLAQYREAIPPLKRALELDPDNSRAADLLEDAEAGRTRIDYAPPKNSNGNVNANANANASANGNTANSAVNTNSVAKPTPVVKQTPKPEKPTPKPE